VGGPAGADREVDLGEPVRRVLPGRQVDRDTGAWLAFGAEQIHQRRRRRLGRGAERQTQHSAVLDQVSDAGDVVPHHRHPEGERLHDAHRVRLVVGEGRQRRCGGQLDGHRGAVSGGDVADRHGIRHAEPAGQVEQLLAQLAGTEDDDVRGWDLRPYQRERLDHAVVALVPLEPAAADDAAMDRVHAGRHLGQAAAVADDAEALGVDPRRPL